MYIRNTDVFPAIPFDMNDSSAAPQLSNFLFDTETGRLSFQIMSSGKMFSFIYSIPIQHIQEEVRREMQFAVDDETQESLERTTKKFAKLMQRLADA